VLLSFNVTDQDATVPVQVEVVSLGSDRVEANLQAFALGGAIPAGVLDSPVAALERRVATTTSTASV
jgi:Tfp pilus assembly PilM family ATPase